MRLAALPESVDALGPHGAAVYWAQRVRRHSSDPSHLLSLVSKRAAHPLVFRPETSDLEVFYQIFVLREFAPVDDLTGVDLVVDLGANAGYSAAYFLNQFPGCTVVAVEPEPTTFAVLERNLAPYAGRFQALNRGIWSHPARLRLSRGYRDGGAWAIQVHEARDGETADVDATDVPTILRLSGRPRISLLKVDIEGAEAIIFKDAPWLDHVDNIVIELHDDTSFGASTEIFQQAIAGRGYRVSHLDERTICRRG